MPVTNINTNYTDTLRPGTQQTQNQGQISTDRQTGQGVVVSGGGIDLATGQTFSGQIINIEGKDIKLLLSNGQTVNASLEGSIKATLGQILSLEVASNDNGKMSLRPLYTNLNNSSAISNALFSANLPNTEVYNKMVDSMMNQGMPINKNALAAMAQKINTFPNADPATLVELSKLNIPINEVTISQYENYKGLEHQIINDVNNISEELTNLLDSSLEDARIAMDYYGEAEAALEEAAPENKAPMSKLLNAFLNAINGDAQTQDNLKTGDILQNENVAEAAEELAEGEDATVFESEKQIDAKSFDTARHILNLVDANDKDAEILSEDLTRLVAELSEDTEVEDAPKIQNALKDDASVQENAQGLSGESGNAPSKETKVREKTTNDLFNTVKNVLDNLEKNPESVSEKVRQKLTELLSDKEFAGTLKNTISKQMLLKPEDVTSNKNIEDLYSKIAKQANLAMDVLKQSGKDNPALLKSAANINDNVNFMNQLNHAVTYVQIPLLMNNKSAHGDLYVYTKKKNLAAKDGNVSALLHLDMDNLGPMDVYVSLTDYTKVNTHFYLSDDSTIDFIEAHIDLLNEKLQKKGYTTSVNMSVKDMEKGPTRMTDEFMKNDPLDSGISFSKFSFDVRA